MEDSTPTSLDKDEIIDFTQGGYFIGNFSRGFKLSKLNNQLPFMKISGFQCPINRIENGKILEDIYSPIPPLLPSAANRTDSSDHHSKTMEKEGSSIKNLLSFYNPSYAPDDPSMNVSVYSSGVSKLSPYLNVDPYVSQEPEFILPEGSNRQRGRFEFAFGTIGSGVMVGGAIGALNGLYTGVKATQGMTGHVRRTQLINYISKQGGTSANALGVIAVMYSGFGCFLHWYRDTEDDANTLAAATATGLLYKSSSGLRRCGIGGGLGFALAAAYCLWRRGDKDRSIVDYVGSTRYTSF